MSTTVGGDHAPARHELDPLADLAESGDGSGLRAHLERLGVRVADVDALPKWNVEVQAAGATYGDAVSAREALVRDVLRQAISTLARHPYGVVQLFAYLAYECDETWEVSYHYEPMWATLAELRHQWETRRPWRDEWERSAGVAMLDLIDNLDSEIRAENSMTCGFIEESGQYYRKAHAAAVRGTARAEALRLEVEQRGDTSDAARAAIGAALFVEGWTGISVVFDDAVAWAADGISGFLAGTGRPDPGASPLATAEAQLLELYLAADAYPGDKEEGQSWSELRAHRLDLDALREVADDQWLYVDDGTIVYVYPFGLRHPGAGTPGAHAHSHQHDAYEDKLRATIAAAARWELAGEVPVAVRPEFRLDDVWQSTDAGGRRFDGVRLELPEVTLRGPGDDGSVLATLQAEIRLSKLGNHYVRFEGRLRDANAGDMFAALRRPAPEHGKFIVGYGDQKWPRLSTLAMELTANLADQLEAQRTAREGMFQVLVTIDAASTGRGPAAPRAQRTEVRSMAELRAAAGAPVLFNAVSHVMTSLAEWSRYETAGDNLVDDGTARQGRAIVRTCNTTVHFALGAPHWELGTAVSLSEFVASLEGLFARWMEELNDFQASVNEQRKQVDAAARSDTEHLRVQVNELRRIRLRLQTFVTDCRSTIALINSPALVRSPVVAANLAALVEAGGVRRRTEEFDHRAAEILSDRLDEIIERVAREQEDAVEKDRQLAEGKHRTRMDTLLAIIAAVGVSGLGQILQAGYGLQGGVSLQIALAIVVLAVVVGVGVWIVAPRTSAARTTRRSAPAPAPVPPGRSTLAVPTQGGRGRPADGPPSGS